jgi:hypothetical protein
MDSKQRNALIKQLLKNIDEANFNFLTSGCEENVTYWRGRLDGLDAAATIMGIDPSSILDAKTAGAYRAAEAFLAHA